MVGRELDYIAEAVQSGEIKGDGPFTAKCHQLMEEKFGAAKVFLTSSGTAALEMASVLCDLSKDDEVILPSYTFPSTANAFLLRAAKLVFVDVREDTLNMDENLLKEKITSKTKVICPVHYAGVSCEMDPIIDLAQENNLLVVEDAAQGVMAQYKNKYLGTLGHIGAYSFHETKNYSSGEGGAIVLKDPEMINRAEIVWEKGTNRSQFFRGETSKYSWVEIGGSYLPSEIIAAFLYAQLEKAEEINLRRLEIWNYYYDHLRSLAINGSFRLPIVPEDCQHNAHMFYLLMPDKKIRDDYIKFMKQKEIETVFHYLPLHSSKMGQKLGYKKGDFPITEKMSDCIVRLPFSNNIEEQDLDEIIQATQDFFSA